MRKEIFIRVKGYENYLVSDLGRVFNEKSGRFLKPSDNGLGYLRVCLSKNGKGKNFRVHRLVLEAFKPNTKENEEAGRTFVDHIDTDKTNNTLKNLHWCTRSENMSNPLTIKKKSVAMRKPVSYYETTATQRGTFKRKLQLEVLNFEDFEEIDSGERYRTHKKYFYKKK